ncbi:MAG: beta-propeller domain-containing protein [Chthoniobacteraceae bacterium]
MNRLSFSLALILFCGLPLEGRSAGAGAKGLAQAAQSGPVITGVRGCLVGVRIPAGFERVTLQMFVAPPRGNSKSARAARGQWKAVAINYPKMASASIGFRLAKPTARRLLRVLGTQGDALPGDLLTGITSFLAEEPIPVATSGGELTFSGQAANLSTATLSANTAGSVAAVRTVSEADIWKVDGDRLYFFNERRGLQVFDISAPDDPALLGTLRMPAMGEDMYLLDAAHVVLIKKAWNWYWWDWETYGGGVTTFGAVNNSGALTLTASASSIIAAQSLVAPQQQANGRREIVIADVHEGQPGIVGRVEFEGTVRESRLVGQVLYLATDTYRPAVEGALPQWGLEVTSFDLHDPAHPVRQASIHLGGWANAVTANDHTLLIAKWGATGGTDIDILDISDPNGAMTRGASVSVEGSVDDKFKLREAGGILTVVSQKWRERTRKEIDDLLNLPADVRPPDYVTASRVGITAVNTFSLVNPAAPVPLGSLDLALDETLHATRFDGDRLYVITAQHRPWIHLTYVWDPLWIVDLANPAQPNVLGELEMPGFSTYIEPLGDRLVTIGLVDWKPTVSLFDISDASKPAELSRVVLDTGTWTSSGAVWNEKEFSVLPDENLILMPLSGWDWTSGSTAGVQLLDLQRDRIVRRGLLERPFAPRRATVHGKRIVAISPTSLLAIDATNRDKPRITADIDIAWNVERVFVVGAQVVQLGSEWKKGNEYEISLTVTPAESPDETLDSLTLKGAPVSEATLRDGVLYVLQIRFGESSWDYATGVYRETSPDHITLSAVDLSRLPHLALLGSVTADISQPDRGWYGWGAPARSLWINEKTLGFNIAGGGRQLLSPIWYDPEPYDTYNYVWIPNPDAPSVDGAAIDAESKADVTVTQIYVGKSAGHYEAVKTGTIDPPGYWYPSQVYRNTQRVLAFDVGDASHPRFASHLEIGADQPWDVAPPVANDGSVFASYQDLGDQLITAETFSKLNSGNPRSFPDRANPRRKRHFLQEVDYADPAKPIVSPENPNLPGRLVGTAREGKVLFTTGPRYNPESGIPTGSGQVLHATALAGKVVHLLDQLPLGPAGRPELRGSTVFQFTPQPAKVWVPSNEPPPVVNQPIVGLPAVGQSILTSITLTVQPTIIFPGNWNPGTYEDNPQKSILAAWELGADGRFAPLGRAELAHSNYFQLIGNLGVGYERANQPHFLDVTEPSSIGDLGSVNFEGAPSLDYHFADGAIDRGLWIPAGQYGLEAVVFPR